MALEATVKGLVSRGVKSMEIVDRHLIATLTDNSTVDLGQVVSELSAHADTHALGGVDALTPVAIGAAASEHSHAQSDVTGLGTALSGKAAAAHSHAQGDITGLGTALSGKAASAHSHAQSDISGLDTALSGKAASTHAAAHAVGGADALTPANIGAVPTSEKGAASGVATLDALGKVTPEQVSSNWIGKYADYTLDLSMAGQLILTAGANNTDVTVTVPANGDVPFPLMTEIEILRWGAGAVTIAPAAGVSVSSVGSVKTIADRFGVVSLKKLSETSWLLVGALG